MKISANDRKNIQFALIAGGAIFVIYKVFGGVSSLLETFGLKSSESDIKTTQAATSPESPFSPNYFQNMQRKNVGKTIMLLTSATANALADQIYNSAGYFYDDWGKAFGAIKQCKYKTQISFLAYTFEKKYKADLITWLLGTTYPADRFSSDEVNQAVEYASKLPTGVI